MNQNQALNRLRKELAQIKKNPIEHIECCPLENNLFEWHYVIHSLPYEPYKGGFYYGKIVFPVDYPYKPPSIELITPNGRFKTNTRICMSNTNFHKESWNPLWNVSSILQGFLSFMLEEDATTYGSMTSTHEEKKRQAKSSAEFNSKIPLYCKLFPELVELAKRNAREAHQASGSSNQGIASPIEEASTSGNNFYSWILAIIVVLIVIYIAK
ncbi:hypothetical protein FDP41_009206 [Naegleria fowleri]|uniref:UBC core domain-containing protein n=1 Tax=Naegleria fowleri TaxID=5763 RepID=A0A6A5AWV1_NAEFO|nr:uncharacterized protein FDP41_009206 [Naegleria fowleri]KAF0972303.1 hypothetical protein FDP41_009206 [Naegleria fowleri]